MASPRLSISNPSLALDPLSELPEMGIAAQHQPLGVAEPLQPANPICPAAQPWRARIWDMQAMLWGTVSWMYAYKCADQFADMFGEDLGYMLHVITMGLVANSVAFYFVKRARECEGSTNFEAYIGALRYFILCTPQDIMYEVKADWIIAVGHSGNLRTFDYEKYADPTYSLQEVGLSLLSFNLADAIQYYLLLKMIAPLPNLISRITNRPINLDHDEEALLPSSYRGQRFLRQLHKLLSTDVFQSIKSGMLSQMFYFVDKFCPVDEGPVWQWSLYILLSGSIMAVYGCGTDGLPDFINYVESVLYSSVADDAIAIDVMQNLQQAFLSAQEQRDADLHLSIAPSLSPHQEPEDDEIEDIEKEDIEKEVTSKHFFGSNAALRLKMMVFGSSERTTPNSEKKSTALAHHGM